MLDDQKSREQLVTELHETRLHLAEQVSAQASLAEIGRVNRALFNAFRVGVTISNSAGEIVESNSQARHLLGSAIARSCSHQFIHEGTEILRPDGSLMPLAEYAAVRALNEDRLVENIEMGIATPSGDVVWVNASAMPVYLEKMDLIVTTYCDITTRKHAEQKLRESEEKFRKFFSALPVASVIVRLEDESILESNDAFEKHMGYARDEGLSGRVDDPGMWVHQEERERYLALLKNNESIQNFEAVLRAGNGSLIAVLISAVRVEISGEERIVATLLDISERKRLGENLAETMNRLEDRNTALRVLLEEREQDRVEMERRVIDNMRMFVTPYLEAIRSESRSPQVQFNLDLALKGFEDITSNFSRSLRDEYRALSAGEIRVADLLRAGMTSKDISVALGFSVATANYYRASIRRKLGLVGKKEKLSTFLQSLSDTESETY